MALEERLVTGVDDQVGQLRREKAPQPLHALQLRNLGSDPRLQLTVHSANWSDCKVIVSW